MNIATRGPAYQKEPDAKGAESRGMLMAFIRVAAMIYHMAGGVSFEWPRYASGWSLPELIALIEQFALIDALCDGCAFGLVSKDNLPLLKPWEIVASSKRLATKRSWISPCSCRRFRVSEIHLFSRADGSGDCSISVSVCSSLRCSSFTVPSVDASNSSRERRASIEAD